LGPASAAILDSGADVSTFPASWARSIGIVLEDKGQCTEDEAMTAGGPITIWKYAQGLHIVIEDIQHWVKADFCEKLRVPLLGRTDFFRYYKTTIDERRRSFMLSAYGPDDPPLVPKGTGEL
jgi:hypothetical protein